jgi:hypothetical protein
MATGLCGPCTSSTQCAGNPNGAYCGPSGSCGCVGANDCPANWVCGAILQCIPTCAIDGGTDCSATGQVCNPSNGQCVGCLSDNDCTANTQAPYCSSDVDAGNNCVQCFTPDQCPATSPGCNAQSFFCGYCGQASDCPTDLPLCYQGACVVSCVLSDGGTDCDAGVCQTSTGYCVGCLADGDCQDQANAPFCGTDIDAGNYCVQCLGPADCPDSGLPGCSSQAHSCGFCSFSSDCPATAAYCQYGLCGDSCVLSDGGTFCQNGLCNTNSGLCVNCLTDADCPPFGSTPSYCLNDIDAGFSCVGCYEQSQCAPWPCNSVYYFCGSCGSDSDCPTEAPHCSGSPFGNCTDAG